MIRQNLVIPAPGRIEFQDEEVPPLPAGGLLLRTLATGLSAGTELTFLKGDNPALSETHDPELGLFLPASPPSAYPVTRLGYMEVARIAESRTDAFTAGEVVATTYGHATWHVSDPIHEHVVRLPADLNPLLGVYVAHLGPICANGILHAAADAAGPSTTRLADGVEGRRVVVSGAGLIGLLTAMLAQEHGADEVVIIDEDPRRRETAQAIGFEALDADDSGLVLKTRWRHGARDHGADVVFQCRGRVRALAEAMRIVRPQGTVIDMAFYTETSQALNLGREYHHNGLTLRSAQIGRTPRGTAPTWDRQRLSAETIRLLISRSLDIRTHVVTHVLPLTGAPQLLLDVAARRQHVISAVFTTEP
ncbi:MAG: zinc-binding alcohol dehydrogenase [Nocardioides sp.]|nr:zinc-binding alcohol dehydrogenase [Nocardioides sp.]